MKAVLILIAAAVAFETWHLFRKIEVIMKFQIGDVVIKREGCGLIGEALICRIIETSSIPCFVCDDNNCHELENVEVLHGGIRAGYLPHISECMLELKEDL